MSTAGVTIGGAEHVWLHAFDPLPRLRLEPAIMATEHPTKLCECGCGLPAPVAIRNQYRDSYLLGQSKRFRHGHNGRGHGRPNTEDVWTRIRTRCLRDNNGCLIWQGAKKDGHYGTIRVLGRSIPVHRAVYEYFNGPISQGLEIDHVRSRGCRSRACCEPAHLEAVTSQTNQHRGDSVSGINARKTHCPNGHVLAGDNLIATRSGRRRCKACAREQARLYRRRTR